MRRWRDRCRRDCGRVPSRDRAWSWSQPTNRILAGWSAVRPAGCDSNRVKRSICSRLLDAAELAQCLGEDAVERVTVVIDELRDAADRHWFVGPQTATARLTPSREHDAGRAVRVDDLLHRRGARADRVSARSEALQVDPT